MRVIRAAIVGMTVVASSTMGGDAYAAGDAGDEISVTVTDARTDDPTPHDDDPDCWWVRTQASDRLAEIHNILEGITVRIRSLMTMRTYEVEVTYYSERNTLHRYDETSDAYEYRRVRTCKEGYTPGEDEIPAGAVDWQPAIDPDPSILLVRTKIVTTEIDAPVPQVSPPPEAGVPVNLGVWFAVEEAGPYEAFASLGPRVWARRTARLIETTFDPGNGDRPIVCPGAGVPLPPSSADTVEAGPCGYVYETYDDVQADLTVTITSRWQVAWELSDGRSGLDPDLLTTASFPYDVYEIQTVGTSN